MQQQRIRSALTAFLLAGFTAAVLAQNRPVTQYFYDANGNLTTAVDGLSRSTSQAYDALNRLRTITQPPPAALQPNPVIQLEVNARDDLTRVTGGDLDFRAVCPGSDGPLAPSGSQLLD
jgi:YD repeat-containing protein